MCECIFILNEIWVKINTGSCLHAGKLYIRIKYIRWVLNYCQVPPLTTPTPTCLVDYEPTSKWRVYNAIEANAWHFQTNSHLLPSCDPYVMAQIILSPHFSKSACELFHGRCSATQLPYMSKFSRRIIFAVFLDFSNLQKLSSRNFRIPYTRNSWAAKIVSTKCLERAICENCAPWKFGRIRYCCTSHSRNGIP